MHVQMNNPIGTRGTFVYKGSTLWESYEDQSYVHTMHVQSSILHVGTHVRVLCHVGRTINMGNPGKPAQRGVTIRNASATMQVKN